ncbi:hypothetical protein ACIRG5_26470 [Lentzea sp. NPDC102401]
MRIFTWLAHNPAGRSSTGNERAAAEPDFAVTNTYYVDGNQ